MLSVGTLLTSRSTGPRVVKTPSASLVMSMGTTDVILMTEPLPHYTSAIMRVRRFNAGDTIFIFDTAPNSMYLTTDGWVSAEGEMLWVDTIYDQSGQERHARQYDQNIQVELKFDDFGGYFDTTGAGTNTGVGQHMLCDSFFSATTLFFRIEEMTEGAVNGIVSQFRDVNTDISGRPYIHVGKNGGYLVSVDGNLGDTGTLVDGNKQPVDGTNVGDSWDGTGGKDISVVMDTQGDPNYDMIFALNTSGVNYHSYGKVRYIISYSDKLDLHGQRALAHKYLRWRYSENWMAKDKPTVIRYSNPTMLYALVPFEGYWGPVARLRRIVKGDTVNVYNMRSDGYYETDSGWENGKNEGMYLDTWVDQGLLGNNATQTVESDQPEIWYTGGKWVVQPNGIGETADTSGGFMNMPAITPRTVFTKVNNIGATPVGGGVHSLLGNTIDSSEHIFFSKSTSLYLSIDGTSGNTGYAYRNNDVKLGPSGDLGTTEDILEHQVVSIGMLSGGVNNMLFARGGGTIGSRARMEVECVAIFEATLDETTVRQEIHDELMLKYGV